MNQSFRESIARKPAPVLGLSTVVNCTKNKWTPDHRYARWAPTSKSATKLARTSQEAVSAAYRDQERWTNMSILNCARSGKLLPDRSIREYCRDIWHAEPVRCELLSPDSVKG